MIFVTLGSQKFQFNRLLKELDRLKENGVIEEEIFAQTGASDYKPEHYEFTDFLNRDEFGAYMQKSDMVITHGGTGAIMGAVKNGKKVIAAARLSKYGEHVDDHQLQLLEEFEKTGIIEACYDVSELEAKFKLAKEKTYEGYKSNTKAYLDSLSEFIDAI